MFPRTAWRSAASVSAILRASTPCLRTRPIPRPLPRSPVRTATSRRKPPKSPRVGTTKQKEDSKNESENESGFSFSFSDRFPYLHYLWYTSPAFRFAVWGIGGAGSTFYVYNLEKVPGTGRRRFNWMSAETEKSLAQQNLAPLLQEYRGKILPEWAPETRLVMKVMERLIPNSGVQDGEQWEIRVIKDDQANAFVMPGNELIEDRNKVFVFTGILPICQTEDGLATILGHEIAHNVAHHSAEKLSKAAPLILLGWGITLAVNVGFNVGGFIVDLLLSRPGSRVQEAEADYLGLLIMAKSCYDPDEAVKLWERMQIYAEQQKNDIPQFLSTHPSNRNRIKKIAGWLPQALALREHSACGFESRFMDPFMEAVQASDTIADGV
ncbi:hypothetical protein MMC10_006528 [Thelotrema lepadinum]|nr:hypothetical protein [Thelotrema lepadinum]